MSQGPVQRRGEGFEVDAALLAEGLRLEPARLAGLMRSGGISSRCERGEGSDAGRWRLTFRHGSRVLRLTVDDAGGLLSRSAFDSPLPGGQTGSPQAAAAARGAAAPGITLPGITLPGIAPPQIVPPEAGPPEQGAAGPGIGQPADTASAETPAGPDAWAAGGAGKRIRPGRQGGASG